jgi:hypothetical protein
VIHDNHLDVQQPIVQNAIDHFFKMAETLVIGDVVHVTELKTNVGAALEEGRIPTFASLSSFFNQENFAQV